MVLVDNGGLVKMYAMVNVEQYNLVATGETQTEVFAKYRKLIKSEGIKGGKSSEDGDEQSEEETVSDATFIVKDIQYVTTGGETYVYIKDDSGNVYKQPFADDENIIFISTGDRIKLTYKKSEGSDIMQIIDTEVLQ